MNGRTPLAYDPFTPSIARETLRRKAYCVINVGGIDVTNRLDPHLLSVTVILRADMYDEAHIEIDDRDGRLPTCTTIIVTCTLEGFSETPHDHVLTMKTGATLATNEVADAVVTKLMDLSRKQWQRTYTFNVSPGVTKVCFAQTGTTNTPQDTYHVAERTFYSQ